jgi:hypothetical protein
VRARTQPANAIVGYALSGGDAHVASRTVFDGLAWRFAGARVEGSPHTLYDLLNHMIFWQDGVLEWLKGRAPQMPEHAADGWPGRPLEMLAAGGAHNGYHAGQAALLRRLLRQWPPPSGGFGW